MSRIDVRHFPELSRMMFRREREANYVRSRRTINSDQCGAILTFWRKLGGRIQEEDDLTNMTHILGELKSDIDMLKALRQTLSMKGNEPEHAAQMDQLLRLLALLLEFYDTFERWHWHLRDRALAYYLAVNPAMPSKAEEKREAEKDKRKKGKQDAQKVLDLGRKEPTTPRKEKKP